MCFDISIFSSILRGTRFYYILEHLPETSKTYKDKYNVLIL